MISLVVCSISESDFKRLSESISNTIGVEFEIVRINNLLENLSIAQAYNRGADLARFDYLVFVHEDVVFYTQNWGLILIRYFKTLKKVGVLGIAGSSYQPISPTDWWVSDKRYIHSNFLSNSKGGIQGQGVLKCQGEQIPQKVFSLDGMFLALKKSVFLEFSFDESLEGFHGYDTDLCYQVGQKYQNYFLPNILLEHFSVGNPNSDWLKNTIAANKKILPLILKTKFIDGIDPKLEYQAFHLFLGQLNKFGENKMDNIRLAIFYFNKLLQVTKQGKMVPLLLRYLLVFAVHLKQRGSTKLID